MVGHIVPLLSAPSELEDKIRLVAQRISVGAGYDAVNIDIFSQRSGPPNVRNVFARVPNEVIETWRAEQRRVEDDPFIQLLLRTRRGIIVADPQNDQRLTETQRSVLRTAELRSAIVVPLFWGDDMIGVLSVASKREGAFTPRDVQFLTTVATQVTAIVRMATLVDELQSSSSRLAQAQDETVMLLAAAAEARDHTTGLHLQGVRTLTEALAQELDYSEEEAHELGLAAVLHDIGKIRVPDRVLTRSGRLTGEAWEQMKRHTVWGGEFLAGRPGFELAAAIARSHHERWDGTGYPDGLSGEAIPEAATIVAVADSFDAMTHDRPYRKRRSVAQAVREIVACSGKQLSPEVVAALERLHRRKTLPIRPAQAPGKAA
jgi:HD-GYP domain-containing protein (c-di-GMP phosphodiesterase class II)